MSKHFYFKPRFLPYFCTQFLGAFNDMVYKNALMIFIAYRLVLDNQTVLLNIAAMMLILPFPLFGAIAGQIADKYEKSSLIRKIKFLEICIVMFGCVAILTESTYMMLGALFLLGTQSTFFGPIKYSILPQHLKSNELLHGNAIVESATFISILIGTILGGFLGSDAKYETVLVLILLAVSISGYITSFKIPIAKPADPELKVSFNVWRTTRKIIREARKNVPVFQSILAISWFWFFGSILLTQFPTFAETVLYGDANVATLLLAVFSVGIGLGSFACAYLSGDSVEVGLMPIGALGISVFTWLFSQTNLPATDELRTLVELFVTPGIWSVVFYMLMISFSLGMCLLPMYTFMQVRSNEAHRSRTIAVNNILNAFFMFVAGILAVAMVSLGYTVLDIFKVVAVLNFLVTVYIISVVPEFFLRLISWLLIHSIYRIKKSDLHHIPKEGPAVLVCNHVSFIDPILIFAVSPRPIRFVMYHAIYDLPVVNMLFKLLKTIPIASRKEKPEVFQLAFDTIADAIDNNEVVCIFPEGAITRDGELGEFKSGIEKIIQRSPVPVVPMAISGLWGTWFSRYKGRAMSGFPNSFMKNLSIVSEQAINPDDVNREKLYERVLTLRGNKK